MLGNTSLRAQILLDEETAVSQAIQHSAALKTKALQIQQQLKNQGTAWNIPSPEIQLESPTGQFYSVGFIQSMEFPLTYIKQRQYAKANTVLAEKERDYNQQQLAWEVRLHYLRSQHWQQLRQELAHQDSLWQTWLLIARRQFDAGEINALDKISIGQQAALVRQQQALVVGNARSALQVLAHYTNRTDSLVLPAFAVRPYPSADGGGANALLLYAQQNEQVALKNLELERSRLAPSFYVGYLNQAARETGIAMRFRAGITVPLWFHTNRAKQQVAKIGVEIAKSETEALQQQIDRRLLALQGQIATHYNQIELYEKELLPQSEELLAVAQRLWQAGEFPYNAYIDRIAASLKMKLLYWDAVLGYNVLVLEYEILK